MVKPFSMARLADTDPGDIALADVHHTLDVVDQVMDLALDDRLEIGLELASGHLDINTQRQGVPFFQIGDVGTVDDHLAVIDLVHFGHLDQLGGLGFAAAHLAEQIGTADALALVGRTEGTRNIDLGDRGLQAADLHRFFNHFIVGHVGHDVLVGADAGGQDLGNVGVGQGRETPVDRTGRRGRPFGVDVTQGVHEGKDPVLVVEQHLFVVTRLDTTEGHGGPVGEPEGEDGR